MKNKIYEMDIRSYLLLLLAFNSTFAQVKSSPISILQSPVKTIIRSDIKYFSQTHTNIHYFIGLVTFVAGDILLDDICGFVCLTQHLKCTNIQ